MEFSFKKSVFLFLFCQNALAPLVVHTVQESSGETHQSQLFVSSVIKLLAQVWETRVQNLTSSEWNVSVFQSMSGENMISAEAGGSLTLVHAVVAFILHQDSGEYIKTNLGN